ncbi:MAG: HDIG domain-containing protein [Chthonomonadales bacterium]|nr:HDIG domain-containing protein [Chthonomonadales bacterium]
MKLDRASVWELLNEYTQSESLLKHALAVEAAMRYYARLYGEDEETWGAVGLIHDFDYERWPTAPDHPQQGMRILRERGWPDDLVLAVGSHADYTGIERNTLLARALFAVDELCGFLTAVAYVRPSRKIADVEVSSVKKKMKDKAFARAVSRDDIIKGAEELGVPLDEHIANCIAALTAVAPSLGL